MGNIRSLSPIEITMHGKWFVVERRHRFLRLQTVLLQQLHEHEWRFITVARFPLKLFELSSYWHLWVVPGLLSFQLPGKPMQSHCQEVEYCQRVVVIVQYCQSMNHANCIRGICTLKILYFTSICHSYFMLEKVIFLTCGV